MVTWQGLALVGLGLATGMVTAFALGRFISSLLYGIEPTDLLTFVAAPAVMLAAGLAAALLPAWRASRIEPVQALRYE